MALGVPPPSRSTVLLETSTRSCAMLSAEAQSEAWLPRRESTRPLKEKDQKSDDPNLSKPTHGANMSNIGPTCTTDQPATMLGMGQPNGFEATPFLESHSAGRMAQRFKAARSGLKIEEIPATGHLELTGSHIRRFPEIGVPH